MKRKMIWRWWAKALGQKASNKDHEADKVAIIRSVIFATYLLTNCFIVAGVVRHWNDEQTINIEIYENSTYSEVLHSKRRYSMGVGGDARIEGVYHTAAVKNSTGEFE